jgi:hypothetical protein
MYISGLIFTETITVSGSQMVDTVYRYSNLSCTHAKSLLGSVEVTVSISGAASTPSDGYNLDFIGDSTGYQIVKINDDENLIAFGALTDTHNGQSSSSRPDDWDTYSLVKQ